MSKELEKAMLKVVRAKKLDEMRIGVSNFEKLVQEEHDKQKEKS